MDFDSLSCKKQHLVLALAPLMLMKATLNYSDISSIFTAGLYSTFQDHRLLKVFPSSSISILSPQYDK